MNELEMSVLSKGYATAGAEEQGFRPQLCRCPIRWSLLGEMVPAFKEAPMAVHGHVSPCR